MGDLRAIRGRYRDPKQHESCIRVVRIGRNESLRYYRARFRSVLCNPSVALADPLQYFADGSGLAEESISIDPLLEPLLDRDLAGGPSVCDRDHLAQQHL